MVSSDSSRLVVAGSTAADRKLFGVERLNVEIGSVTKFGGDGTALFIDKEFANPLTLEIGGPILDAEGIGISGNSGKFEFWIPAIEGSAELLFRSIEWKKI